jgi:phosphonopyruvate decarboxylase
MITAENFIRAAKGRGFEFYSGVPCSYLTPFINAVIDAPELQYVGAANEGDAVAIATGAALAGKRSVVMFQNAGLGNAVNPLTSLNSIFKIPILVIVTWRGEPDGAPDEPQHKLMGAITPQMLELMQIPWEFFPTVAEEIEPVLQRAVQHMIQKQSPYALIMRKASVQDCALNTDLAPKPVPVPPAPLVTTAIATPCRTEMLSAIQSAVQPQDVLLTTTGYCGRELYALEDRANQLYMVGSMGCVSSLGLGIALTQPQRRVIAIDGDGAALMRLGAWATIGYQRPENLVHVLLDNQVHDSTGGQSTVSHSIDFCAIAASCGYPKIIHVTTPAELQAIVADPPDQLTFVYAKIRPGVPDSLPRPKVSPESVAQRLRHHLEFSPRG